MSTFETHIFSVKEAAKYLRLNQSTVYRFLGEGVLPHHRFGKKRIFFTQQDLDEFLDGCKVEKKNQGAGK